MAGPLTTTASTTVTVDADSKEAAIEAAICGDLPTICAQCSGYGRDDLSLDLGDEWDVPDDDSVYLLAEGDTL